MTNYTPTTDKVKFCYAMWVNRPYDDASAEFDRWLADHDAEVYQRGREDAAKAVEDYGNILILLNYISIEYADAYTHIARGDGEQG